MRREREDVFLDVDGQVVTGRGKEGAEAKAGADVRRAAQQHREMRAKIVARRVLPQRDVDDVCKVEPNVGLCSGSRPAEAADEQKVDTNVRLASREMLLEERNDRVELVHRQLDRTLSRDDPRPCASWSA